MKSMVETVMTEEWKLLCETNSELPSCSELLFSQDEEILYVCSIIDEIQESLKVDGKHGFFFLSAIVCPWLNFGLPPRCPQVVWCH